MANTRRLTGQELTDALNRIIQDCALVINDLQTARHRSQQERQFVGLTKPGLSSLLAKDINHFSSALDSVVDHSIQKTELTESGGQLAYNAIFQLLQELGASINEQQQIHLEIHENAVKISKLWGEAQAFLPCPN